MRAYRFLLVLVALLSYQKTIGQKEDYIWYFGHAGVGLDFNGCDPVVVNDGNLDESMWEGAASLADAETGDLLFYTSGLKVYNADHQVMLNGDPVGLSNSLAQMVVVPWPGSLSKYYLFIPELQGGVSWYPLHPAAFSLYYAVIDMSLEGGLGGVESKFNVLFTTPHCEFLTAIPHANGMDYWLVGHEFNSSRFFTYAISSAGISPTPIFQDIGPVIETPQLGGPHESNLDAVGSMRASPDGRQLAFTTNYNGITCLYDFDAASGVISEPIELSYSGSGYGLTFSPDGSKLYVSARAQQLSNAFQNGRLVQFDLASGSPQVIQASATIIYQITGNGGMATLKLGPDGKAYVARAGSDGTTDGDFFLGIVDEPNLAGSLCSYTHDGLWLGGHRGSWGLSNSLEFGHNCRLTDIPERDINCNEVMVRASSASIFIALPCAGVFTDFAMVSTDGRTIVTEQLDHETIFSWDARDLRPGVYLVTLTGPNSKLGRKILVLQ